MDQQLASNLSLSEILSAVLLRTGKITRTQGSFPNEEAALKLLYLAIRNVARNWSFIQGWREALNRFQILWPPDQVGMKPQMLAELPVHLRQSAVKVLQIAECLTQQPAEVMAAESFERTAQFDLLVVRLACARLAISSGVDLPRTITPGSASLSCR